MDANGLWDVDTAVRAIGLLDKAAGGLEYVEQPCLSIEELAADASIHRAEDPLQVAVAGAADISVIKCTPLGGVRCSLRVTEAVGLPCVVSSALETSGGPARARQGTARARLVCGLGTLSLLRGDVVAEADLLRPVKGYLPVPRAPAGPDPALLEAHQLADPERVTWWRERLGRVCAELGNL